MDPCVRDLVARHLERVDDAAPGLVTKLYLVGSVALADFRPATSDVDFLAVTSRALTADDLAALATVHADPPSGPDYDGIYLDPAALAATPDSEEAVPHVVGGAFHATRPCGELNPVLWLTLVRYGIPVRGPEPAALPVRVDEDRLRRYNLTNLATYWRSLASRIREVTAGRAADAEAPAGTVVWTVLGPARLHYTLATGDVASKTRSAAYVSEAFPHWADLAARAARYRDGEQVAFTTTDAVAAAALVDAVVADAHTRWG